MPIEQIVDTRIGTHTITEIVRTREVHQGVLVSRQPGHGARSVYVYPRPDIEKGCRQHRLFADVPCSIEVGLVLWPAQQFLIENVIIGYRKRIVGVQRKRLPGSIVTKLSTP